MTSSIAASNCDSDGCITVASFIEDLKQSYNALNIATPPLNFDLIKLCSTLEVVILFPEEYTKHMHNIITVISQNVFLWWLPE